MPFCLLALEDLHYLAFQYFDFELNKDNNKITELPTILQRESQNS
jgi:hypothetical protein